MAQDREDNVNVHYNIKKPRGRATLQRNMPPRSQYHKPYRPHESGMGCSLTYFGIVWSFLSFIAMGFSCVGFYLPFWLEGAIFGETKSSLGVFRRCNYPTLNEQGEVVIIMECGRYSTFLDIPSFWWQVATVSIGTGCCLTIMVSFAAILACCMRDILTHRIAKCAGVMQFFAGMCIGTGCLLYPLGWDSSEVNQVCGDGAALYQLGECTISWAYYCTVGGGAGSLLCALLSCSASKHRYSGYQM